MLISQWPASDLNGGILSMLLVRRLDHTNAVETGDTIDVVGAKTGSYQCCRDNK